jgi:hypothetical protein
VFGLTGLLSTFIGLIAAGFMCFLLLSGSNEASVGEMLAGCTLYLGLGGAWLLAAWFYWRGSYRNGLILTFVGLALPAMLFSILGI